MKRIITNLFTPIVGLVFMLSIFGCGNEENKHEVASDPIRCTQCPTISTSQDTIEFVNEVRRFIAKNADDGILMNSLCDTFAKIPIQKFPVDEYLQVFEQNTGVSTCGLSSKIMVKILLENGIDAYTYNFGFKNTRLSHVVVLVKQKGKLLIFDPYMNYELLDGNGNNLDLFSLINMVGKQELKVSVNEDTVLADLNADYSIVSEGYKQLLSSAKCKSLLDSRKLLRDSVFQVQVSKCFGCDKNRKCFSFVREFEQKLLEDTDFNLFHEGMVMKINNLEGADDWESMNDLVETAIYSQPNLGKRIKARSNN